MAIDKETLDLASQKKYTDFSNAVKAELKSKLSNHKKAKEYVSDYDKLQAMKASFAKITNSGKESEEPEKVPEEKLDEPEKESEED